MEGIKVPVSLEVVLSSITAVKNAIANLKPESKNWKTLLEILRTMEREADRLSITMSKPFTSEALFTLAEKSIDKIDEALSKASLTMSRLKFSDILLTPELKATFDTLNLQLVDILNLIKSFKANAKAELQKENIWQDIIKIDPNAATRTFDELLKVVRKKNTELQSELKKAQEAANDFLKLDKAASFTEKVFKEADPLSDAGIGKENFERFFMPKVGKTGEFQFKSGQKAPFYEWVKENFTLTDELLEQIKGKSGLLIIDLFRGFKEQALLKANETHETNALKSAEVAEIAVKAASGEAAVNAMGEKVDQLATLQGNLAGKTAAATKLVEDFKNSTAQAARESLDFLSAEHLMQSALDQLRGTLNATNADFLRMQRVLQSFSQMKSAVVNFMGFSQVLNLTRNAVRGAIEHIRELDTVMNGIAIVTDMSTGDLWNLVDAYSKMAQSYGVSIKGAYEVSQIYYQQGLETADVMTLTNETLKLAKISGLDYATTTDYMTTALRGFKIEMLDAARIVDVYSALAANTAVSQEELAVAMSKTASSMEGVGATFEEASAMIGTMVAVTRESATNIGSAMKSIASRYGELTKDPTKLVDEDGEAMAFNKVDAALQSVGISMKTVDGLFRNFTEVIIELGEKWDLLDSTQLRYIATLFAGNRQQSRFLALVSNVDMLKSNLDVAMNSEDTGTLQALKALDSIESKTEQVRVAYLLFYTTIGAETVWKGFLDGAKDVINTLNSLPKLFGKIPISAVGAIMGVVTLMKSLVSKALSGIAEVIGHGLASGLGAAESTTESGATRIFNSIIDAIKGKIGLARQTGEEIGKASVEGAAAGAEKVQSNLSTLLQLQLLAEKQKIVGSFNQSMRMFPSGEVNYDLVALNMFLMGTLSADVWELISNGEINAKEYLTLFINETYNGIAALLRVKLTASSSTEALNLNGNAFTNFISKHGKGLSTFGQAMNMAGMLINTSTLAGKRASGALMGLGGAFNLAGIAAQAFNHTLNSIPWMAIVSGVFAVINGISQLVTSFSLEAKIEELTKKAEELTNLAKLAKAEYKTLDNSLKKLDELKEKRYESAEAAEEYLTAVEKLADEFPALITGFDEAGNIMIDTADAESVLTEARKKAAQATYDAALAEYEKILLEIKNKQKEVSEGKTGTASAGLAHYIFRAIGFDPTNTTPEIQGALEALAPYISNNNGTPEKDINTKEGRSALHALGIALQSSGAFYGDDSESLQLLLEAWQAEADAMGNLTDLMNDRVGYARQIVSGWQKTTDADTRAWAYLYDSAGAAAMVTLAITDDLLSKGLEVSGANAAIIDNEQLYRTNMNNFISGLSKEQLEIFNNMYSAPELYTSSDFKAIFAKDKNWNNIVEDIIDRNYETNVTNILQLLQDRLNLSLTYIDKEGKLLTLTPEIGSFYNEYSTKITEVETRAEQAFLNNILLLYESLSSAGFMSLAESTGKAALKVFDKLNNIKIADPLLFGSINSAMTNYNLNTKTDIEEFILYLLSTETIDDDVIIGSLLKLQETLSSNIALTIQSLTSSVVDSWSDDSKILSKLTSGLDLSEVNSVITQASKMLDVKGNKLLLSLSDFLMNGDKLVLVSDKAETYWLLFFKALELKIESTELELDKAISALGGITSETEEIDFTNLEELTKGNIIDSAKADFYKTILGEQEFEKYFKALADDAGNKTGKFEVLAPKGSISLSKAVEAAYTENSRLISEYYKYIDLQRDLILKTAEWAEGNYSSINEYLQDGDTFESILKDKSKLSKYAAIPEVKNAYENATSAFGNLISDILTLGFDSILLEDYKGIFGITKEDLEAYKTSGNYVSFISKYAALAGKSIDETNDLILQAIEKQNETSSVDLVKDILFTKNDMAQFTRETLGLLANAYNIPLLNLIMAFLHGFDSRTLMYTIGIQELLAAGIDLSSVDNLRDAILESVESLLNSIASLIKNALSGSLDIKGRNELITNLGLLGINIDESWFTRTKEGYKLAYNQVAEIYDLLKAIDDITSLIALDVLNESAEKSSSALLQRNKELEESIKYQKNLLKYEKATRQSGVDLFDKLRALGSPVDFYNRPLINRGNGEYSTLSTATLDSRNFLTDAYWAMNITPIMANGLELSEENLNEYVLELIDKGHGDLEQIKLLDSLDRKLIIRLQESNAERIESDVNILANEAQELHEVSEAFEAIVGKHDKYDSTKISQYERELALNREIMEIRATTESDDFKFMENKIPSGLNNPLNYYENWGKAWKTILEAGKNKNLIDYQDFYNIITEMGKLASDSNLILVSGEHILTSAEDAANLIELAGAALTVAADGSIKVDLGKLGIDFSAGAGDMAKGVDAGIKELALSLIDMLDGMIQLMETIVAMEELSDVTGEDNTIDLSDILPNIEYDENKNLISIGKFSEGYETWRQKMLELLKLTEKDKGYNKDLLTALKGIFIDEGQNKISLADIIAWDESTFYGADESVKAGYMAMLTAFLAAAKSGDYDLDNIMASVKEVLAGTGYKGTIELGEMKLLFTSNTAFTIDKDGNVVTSDGTKFKNTEKGRNDAVKYTRETELQTLKDIAHNYDEATESVTFSNSIVTNVDYNMEEGVYDIRFSDGSIARATTKAGADLAILTYAKMTNQEIGANVNAETTTFSLHITGEAEANYSYVVTDGKVEVILASEGVDIEKARAAGLAAVDELAEKVAAGITGNAEVSNLNLTLSPDANITINVDKEISLTNPIDNVTAQANSIRINIDNITPEGEGILNPIPYDLLLASIETVEAYFSGEPNTDSIYLEDISYDNLIAAIANIEAWYSGTPDSSNVVLDDITYSEAIGVILANLLLNSNNDTSVQLGSINIDDNKLKITDVINALLTGELILNGTNVKGSAGEITLANGTQITLPDSLSVTGILSKLLLEFSGNPDNKKIIDFIKNYTIPAGDGSGELNSLVVGLKEGTQPEYDKTVILEFDSTNATTKLLIISTVTGEKKVTDLNNISAGDNVNATASTATISADTYHLEWQEVNADGEVITTRTIDIPAKLLFENNTSSILEYLQAQGVPEAEIKLITESLDSSWQSWKDLNSKFFVTPTVANNNTDLNQKAISVSNLLVGKNTADNIRQALNEEEWSKAWGSTVVPITSDFGKLVIDYVTTLKKEGKALSSVDLSNLNTLMQVANNFQISETENLGLVINGLLSLNEINKDTSSVDWLTSIQGLAEISSDNITALASALERVLAAVSALLGIPYAELASLLNSLNVSNPSTETVEIETGTTEISVVTTTDTTAMVEEVLKAKEEATETPATQKIEGDAEEMIETGKDAVDLVEAMKASIKITATSSATSVIMSIKAALDKLVNGGPYKVTVLASVSLAKGNIGRSKTSINNKETLTTNYISATGTVGLAKSKGTLMGELGPELVVSKGRYFVVGLSGPEMVDLADDAIVFNHLQTLSLLTKGMSHERGRAVTNERNAVSFATGNVDGGPAMASAAAALATLKLLRAMWESLLGASVSDLAGAGGGGGGGGGGNKIVDPKAWVKTVERWYNLTQEIAKLEKDITHEETLRSKLQSDFNKNGKHYYLSLRQSLSSLKQLIAAQELLNLSRQDYYTKRIDALKNEPLGKLYTFDENGLMHFRDDVTMNGLNGAMNFLTDLMGFDENGKANYTNKLKYNILKQYGFDEYMKYNSNGEQILLDADHSGDVTDEERETYYQQATEAWRDRMDSYAQETLSLWDSIKEGENSLLELLTSQNEILLEMRDNLIAVEEDVLKAIEDMRQREINALLDERDKLEESTGKYIQGLSDALNKEQEMYNNQLQENDLNQLRRRLAILLRSGGSAADIANLLNEINSNERSQYFDLLQLQIDAILNASDLLIERMDDLIQLMTETLEYLKEYGLLWSDVYLVMNESAARITNFIMGANSEFWTQSPLGSANSANETLFKADQWVEFRKDMTDVTTDVANLAFASNEQKKANDYKIYDSAMKKEFGSNYDSQGKYKGIFELVYDETGDITRASAAARAEYLKDKEAEEAKKLKTTTTTASTSTPSSADSSSRSSNDNNKCKGCAGECTKGCAYSCTGKCDKGCKGACGTDCERGCSSGCKETCKGKCTTECYSSCLGGCKGSSSFSAQTYTSSLPKKAKGGFVKHGIYELGEEGTEGVLNAHQTRVLRDNILSNKPNSLVTLLNTYNEAYKDGISVAPLEASEQLIIENATVNMNVQQIANDYDARRAGELALNEMMRIARKTSAANSIRR